MVPPSAGKQLSWEEPIKQRASLCAGRHPENHQAPPRATLLEMTSLSHLAERFSSQAQTNNYLPQEMKGLLQVI